MSNHKWNKENTCLNCGVHRERKDYKRWLRTETVLRNGVWEDRTVYAYGTMWHYGKKYGFERPHCELIKQGII